MVSCIRCSPRERSGGSGHREAAPRARAPLVAPVSLSPAYGDKTSCRACGARILAIAEICPTCGVRQWGTAPPAVAEAYGRPLPATTAPSEKSTAAAGLLCLLAGVFGAHRFYVGKTATGVVMLCTLGGLGVWVLVDLVLIATGEFKDADERKLAGLL